MNILVTGGASGLGEAITRELLSQKQHRVFFTYHTSQESAKLLESEFENAKGISCDFASQESLKGLISKMGEIDLDILINNAMVLMSEKHFHKMEAGDFLAGFEKNLLPVIAITQKAIEIFRKKKFGKIINILSSTLMNLPPLGLSAYTAEKAYLASLSKSWAVENARFHITSNSISPSLMKTRLTAYKDERIFEEVAKNHPLQRLLTPAEVAKAVAFLVGCSQQINGVNLIMNAGQELAS